MCEKSTHASFQAKGAFSQASGPTAVAGVGYIKPEIKHESPPIAVFRDKLFHVVMEWDEWYKDEDSGPYKGWRRGAIEP